MNASLAVGMQRELNDLFERYSVQVAVGIRPDKQGVVILSQSPSVDARNLGKVTKQTP